MSQNEMIQKVEDLKGLMVMKSELEDQIRELEDQIKDHMEFAGSDELRAGLYMVRWKEITSSRFNSKRFRTEFPDMYNTYCEPVTARRFTLV